MATKNSKPKTKKKQLKLVQGSKSKKVILSKKNKITNSKHKNILNIKSFVTGIAVIALFSVVIALINPQTNITTTNSSNGSQYSKMILESSSQTVKSGDEFTVKIYSNSQTIDVNAVQAAIEYPSELVELKTINSGDSQYPINAYESKNENSAEVVRGIIAGVNNKKFVSELQFIAKSPGSAEIEFNKDTTLLINSNTNTNILNNDSFDNITVEVQ